MDPVKASIDGYRRRAARQELFILVWGPGEAKPDSPSLIKALSAKRIQIREALQTEFPFSRVEFSESPELRRYTEDLGDLMTEEMLHARAADCIIILNTSPSTRAEVDYFSQNATVASRMCVLQPDWEPTGAINIASDRRVSVFPFSKDDIDSCNLATRISIKAAMVLAIRKHYLADH